MTREAKISLLVGLAFIIVVGILLQDYNRLESEPSPWTTTADTLRNGAATPTPHNGSTLNEVVPPPAAAAPSRPIPTQEEVREVTKIAIGPATGSPNIGGDHPPVRQVPVKPINTAINGNPGDAGAETELQRIARERGVEITNVGPTDPAQPHPPTVNGATQYVAIPGDTLSKLAGRFLGGNTKTNRDAIVAVNPTLKQNPNNVIVGRTYVIPGKGAVPTPGASPVPPVHVAVAPAPTGTPENGAMSWYTVKDNDSLWRIAAEQLGDGSAWIAIRDMNKDVLKGGDSVRKNMRLRLPPKSVATIN